MDNYLQLIGTFCAYLSLFKVPYNISPCLGEGYEVTFPWTKGKVTVHDGSYLNGRGFITSYDFPWNEGFPFSCSPQEMGEKVENYYFSLQSEEPMNRYMMHVGVRFTANWEIEAPSEYEAWEKAEMSIADIEAPAGFEFADDDYDILEVKYNV